MKALINTRLRLVVATGFFGFSSLILAFTIAWLVLAKLNFLYPVWHDHVGIAEGIEKYGPKNRYKTGFAETSRAQRISLFEGINKSVHRHGEGLAELAYQSPSSEGPQLLLREPEIIHLQDVANLLDKLKWLVGINALIWAAGFLYLLKFRRPSITWKSQVLGVGVMLVCVIGLMLFIGPVTVFNQLHVWVFPGEHQWFFYYQESLMSTMMLAPDLFGWIAAELIFAAFTIFFALICSVDYLTKRRE